MDSIRARLIYNPTSGREEVRRRLPAILQRLERGGIETSCHATEGEGDAAFAASEAVRRGFDIVISAGGDGTLNEVVSGLSGHERRPSLGILPLGTTNDFARAHGIPKQWADACDLIVRGYTRPVDVGRADDKYFINIAGGGSLTELTYEVPSKLKTMVGQLAYYMKGLEKITRLQAVPMKIIANGQVEIDEELMLFLIANSSSVAGFDKLAPDASTNDGVFDVLALRKCNLAEFIRIATMVMRGEVIKNDPHFIFFQSNNIRVESDDRVQLNLDGEFGGTLPCTFSILPSHLNVIMDEHGESTYRRGAGMGNVRGLLP
ncbi:diacylglycerol kinase [Cohnella sp. CFH 77786]|uniref:diacylglycerol kinase n=1 Tax=Cohnella sp. CFH 77786 TaxID=2662265 RepID=UPI001C60A4EF|nr:diacylglycerol kinase [Cohnella sp. CFH 77786]MBW5445758.1 diacylglycerol kinase [Cohnella sp. CFH 77786]